MDEEEFGPVGDFFGDEPAPPVKVKRENPKAAERAARQAERSDARRVKALEAEKAAAARKAELDARVDTVCEAIAGCGGDIAVVKRAIEDFFLIDETRAVEHRAYFQRVRQAVLDLASAEHSSTTTVREAMLVLPSLCTVYENAHRAMTNSDIVAPIIQLIVRHRTSPEIQYACWDAITAARQAELDQDNRHHSGLLGTLLTEMMLEQVANPQFVVRAVEFMRLNYILRSNSIKTDDAWYRAVDNTLATFEASTDRDARDATFLTVCALHSSWGAGRTGRSHTIARCAIKYMHESAEMTTEGCGVISGIDDAFLDFLREEGAFAALERALRTYANDIDVGGLAVYACTRLLRTSRGDEPSQANILYMRQCGLLVTMVEFVARCIAVPGAFEENDPPQLAHEVFVALGTCLTDEAGLLWLHSTPAVMETLTSYIPHLAYATSQYQRELLEIVRCMFDDQIHLPLHRWYVD